MAVATTAPRLSRFVQWIDEVTPEVIAQKLGVTKWAVYGWRRLALGQAGGSLPNPRRLGDLIRLAGGKITAADIYPPTHRSKK